MIALQQDVTPQEVSRVNQRIARQVLTRAVVPWFALQYRLGEVGQRRTDSRLLARVVKEIPTQSRNLAREGELREPRPGIFLSAALPDGKVEALLSRVTEQLESIHAETAVSVVPDQVLPDGINIHSVREVVDLLGKAPGYQRVTLSATIDFSSAGENWSLWFCHDAKWLYPDDPRLFEHLSYCTDHQLRPLVVARKIAPPTFVLFKALGIRGTQFYSYLLREGAVDALRVAIQDLGWTHSMSARALSSHSFKGRLAASLESSPLNWQRVSEILAAYPFAELLAASDNEPRKLLEWLEISGMATELPERWKSTVARWIVLQNRPGRRTATTRTV